MGALGWPPDVFWGASLMEFTAALDGLADFHGGGEKQFNPLSSEETKRLMEMYPDTGQRH